MNIFFREMKANRKSLIIWCAGMLLVVAAGMGKYAGYSAAGQSVNGLLEQIPQSIRTIFGMTGLDLTKASGFYGVLYLYIAIIASIHASMLGSVIISKEERDRTSEFLNVKPVSRKRIVGEKLSAALINILILNIVTLLFSIMFVGKYSKGEDVSSIVLKCMLGLGILQLIFLFIGTAMAAASKKPKAAVTAASGVMLAAFVIYEAIGLNSNLDFLKYLTPFKYFEAQKLLPGGAGFEPIFLVLSTIIIAAAFVITYKAYEKKDLK